MQTPTFGSLSRPIPVSTPPANAVHGSRPRFGTEADDTFFSLIGATGLTPQQQREAELSQYLEHLQTVLDELNSKPPMWETREPLGHRLQTSGHRLREEAQRGETPDDFKEAVSALFLDCAEQMLDPLNAPADISNAIEDALRELKEDIAVEALQKEMDAY